MRALDHPISLGLLEELASAGGKGVAAPRANRLGSVSLTTAQAAVDELSEYLGESDQILYCGPREVGVESTIIDCTGDSPRILRPDAITKQMTKESTGLSVGDSAAVNGASADQEAICVSGSINTLHARHTKHNQPESRFGS